MANQYFDINRFGLYLRKHVSENRRKFGIYALVLLLLPAAFTCFLSWIHNSYTLYNTYKSIKGIPQEFLSFDMFWNSEILIFNTLFALLATIGASLYYSCLSKKNSRIALFNTPASNLEKAATYFLIYIVATLALFFVGTIIADYARLPICRMQADGAYVHPIPLWSMVVGFKNFGYDPDAWDARMVALAAYVLFGSAYVMFSAVWPKRSYIMTSLFFFALWIVCISVAVLGFTILLKGASYQELTVYDVITDMTCGVAFLISAAVAVVFMATGYARFKEWDVIN